MPHSTPKAAVCDQRWMAAAQSTLLAHVLSSYRPPTALSPPSVSCRHARPWSAQALATPRKRRTGRRALRHPRPTAGQPRDPRSRRGEALPQPQPQRPGRPPCDPRPGPRRTPPRPGGDRPPTHRDLRRLRRRRRHRLGPALAHPPRRRRRPRHLHPPPRRGGLRPQRRGHRHPRPHHRLHRPRHLRRPRHRLPQSEIRNHPPSSSPSTAASPPSSPPASPASSAST